MWFMLNLARTRYPFNLSPTSIITAPGQIILRTCLLLVNKNRHRVKPLWTHAWLHTNNTELNPGTKILQTIQYPPSFRIKQQTLNTLHSAKNKCTIKKFLKIWWYTPCLKTCSSSQCGQQSQTISITWEELNMTNTKHTHTHTSPETWKIRYVQAWVPMCFVHPQNHTNRKVKRPDEGKNSSVWTTTGWVYEQPRVRPPPTPSCSLLDTHPS